MADTTIQIHQDVYGKKAGEVIDRDDLDVSNSTLEWLVGEGYVSTGKSRETDHAGVQTAADDKKRPVRDREDEPTPDFTPPAPAANPGLNPPEAFDPTTHTVEEVKTYLDSIPAGAGHDQEVARVKAVEKRDGDDRKGVADL